MTRWVTRLLIANVLVFLAQKAFDPYVTAYLIFRAADVLQYPWTPLTYMFLHAGVWHLFFNMLALYFFGPAVETRLGPRHFLALYLVSGLTGAAFSFITPLARILGASGAVFGVMLAFARYWPREKIYIWGVIPLEAWMLIAIMTLTSIFGIGEGIAHFAHLGGFAGAFVYIKWMEWRSPARAFKRKVQGAERVFTTDAGALKRWERINLDDLHPINRSEVDRLLAKVKSTGISSLTPDERATLDRFSNG